MEPLVALLRDGDPQGKANAAGVLWTLAAGGAAIEAAMAAAGAMEPLVALVRDGDPQGKANAAGVLWTLAAGDAAIKAAMAATGYSLKDAREAGFTCQEARAAGFKPRDCQLAGFTYEEGKAAGFPSSSHLFWYGKSPPEIRTPVDYLRALLLSDRLPPLGSLAFPALHALCFCVRFWFDFCVPFLGAFCVGCVPMSGLTLLIALLAPFTRY